MALAGLERLTHLESGPAGRASSPEELDFAGVDWDRDGGESPDQQLAIPSGAGPAPAGAPPVQGVAAQPPLAALLIQEPVERPVDSAGPRSANPARPEAKAPPSKMLFGSGSPVMSNLVNESGAAAGLTSPVAFELAWHAADGPSSGPAPAREESEARVVPAPGAPGLIPLDTRSPELASGTPQLTPVAPNAQEFPQPAAEVPAPEDGTLPRHAGRAQVGERAMAMPSGAPGGEATARPLVVAPGSAGPADSSAASPEQSVPLEPISVEQIETIAAEPLVTRGSLRQLRLEVRTLDPDSAELRAVTLEFRERAGEMELTARSGDAGMARSLQESLPELVASLAGETGPAQENPSGQPRGEGSSGASQEERHSGGRRDSGTRDGRPDQNREDPRRVTKDERQGEAADWRRVWRHSFAPTA